ncbi:MAG: aminopeptidase P family protein [Gemmatimonadetes bacterium]|nr:aminopeptidase P family protein [Gemmatimonadota bacterium]
MKSTILVATLAAVVAPFALARPTPVEAQSDVAFPPEVYSERRARLLDRLKAPVIVPGEYMIRHGGEKRQDPNFFYLTGVESPYAVLYMEPAAAGGAREILFLPEHRQFAGAQYSFQDPRLLDAAWNRLIRRLEPGPAAEEATGIAETAPLSDFVPRLRDLTRGEGTVYFAGESGELYAPPGLSPPQTHRQQLEASVAEALGGIELADATSAIERMRVIKDAHEIDALRTAAEISAAGLVEAMRQIEPGMNDLEVAGIMEWVWKREGSPRPAFPPIVASGPDAVSLFTIRSENYNSVDRVMQDGDLVFIDYGAAEWAMYGSDICRTFPVSGRFTEEQRRLYEIVLEAQRAAIAEVRPGASILDAIRAAARVYQAHGLEANEDIDAMGADRVWGLMPSPTHYLTQGRGLTQYTAVAGLGVRDIGHHIGLEATDGRDYSTPLEPGMVFTVEPKLYAPDLEIAIMIEDVILVTETGSENLSASAPRTVAEIERIMGAN